MLALVTLPDADPAALLDAFLNAHASDTAVPLTLFTRGEELHARLNAGAPKLKTWGRFLVAMGELASTHLHDDAAASRYFLQALTSADQHGDHEAAVSAGYNQGVLQERRGARPHALAAYRTAAAEGFRLRALHANTLRAACAAVRVAFAENADHDHDGDPLDAVSATLAKQAWLGWLWLRRHEPDSLDAALVDELGRQLCALLLPEDDPTLLAERWRAWPPHALASPDGDWCDDQPATLHDLFTVAASAADAHLTQEGPDPGAPYRALVAAAARWTTGR